MARHELPSGGWVELRDVDTLRARDRKNVMRNVHDPEDGRTIASLIEMGDGVLAMMVTAWELPYLENAPLPSVDLSVLEELTLPDETELQRLCAPAAKLVVTRSEPDPSDHDDPTSPTAPASE